MFKIFKTLMLFIWLIDIFNISFMIQDIDVRLFLDYDLPINTGFWLLFWLLVPSSDYKIN